MRAGSRGVHAWFAALAVVAGSLAASLAAPTASRAAVPPTVRLAAAGDIACDPTDANYNNGQGTESFCRQQDTAALLNAGGYDAVLPLGDEQYADGTLTKFQQSYQASWGSTKAIQRPVPGNHEYLDPGAAGYFDYFGPSAGDRDKGYYSYTLGGWHVVALNSECAFVGCEAGSPQETWLRADLAANPSTCTLAYWHKPKFTSSDPGSTAPYQAFWNALQDAGAEVVLTGHSHNYERFAPQTAAGVADPGGIRQFVAGTGGKNLVGFAGTPLANSEVRNSSTFGVLEMTLKPDSYDWRFVPAAGSTFTDSGSSPCSPGPAAASPTPSASAVTASPSSSGAPPAPPASSTPAPSASPTAAAPPSACDPTVRASRNELTIGQQVDLDISGLTPGRSVSLEGYGRPSTTYTELRVPTQPAPDGTLRFTVRPPTNTRYRLRVQDCAEPGQSRVLVVHPVLTLRAVRNGTWDYTFSGTFLPAGQNAGRVITLYYQAPGGGKIRRGLATVQPNGSYTVDLRFSGSARLALFFQTGANTVNAGGTSNLRSVLVY